MEAIIICPKDEEQLTVIRYILNALDIPFAKTKVEEDFYNSDFTKKIERAAKDKKAGRYESIKTDDLWK